MDYVKLEGSDAHLILACKGWYDVDGVSRTKVLGILHAAFCGWSALEHNIPYESIADKLYKILKKTKSEDYMEHLTYNLHRWMVSGWWTFSEEGRNTSPIEKIIIFYISEVSMLQVRDKHRTFLDLPKVNKEAAKALILGTEDFTLDLVSRLG